MSRFEVFQDEAGEWRWRLVAANGEPLATSEGYTRKGDAIRAVGDLREAVSEAAVQVYEVD